MQNKDAENRLDRLAVSKGGDKKTYSKGYSTFIRWMRLILPTIAIIIIAVVFTWNDGSQKITPVKQEMKTPMIGKNELLNPRFESKDDKDQPYTITAKRAVQGETNENLVILEEPVADITLKSGQKMSVQAKQGAYRQDNKRLLLKEAVEITHQQGYRANMDQLHVDMDKNNAWSETDVFVEGPEGTIEARGMTAESQSGILVFSGPAKLTLVNNDALGALFHE